MLPPLGQLKSKPGSPKTWANLYLWFRYGLSLSVKDAKKLVESIPLIKRKYLDMLNKHTRARSSMNISYTVGPVNWSCRLGYRILIDTFPEELKTFGKFVDGLYALGLAPTTSNLWDLIPFSFVVDWFIPIGEWLELLDHTTRVQSFQIYSVTTSEKWERNVPPPPLTGYTVTGSLREIHYIRRVGTSLHLPPLEWRGGIAQDTSKTFVRRLVDGVALLIQRRF